MDWLNLVLQTRRSSSLAEIRLANSIGYYDFRLRPEFCYICDGKCDHDDTVTLTVGAVRGTLTRKTFGANAAGCMMLKAGGL